MVKFEGYEDLEDIGLEEAISEDEEDLEYRFTLYDLKLSAMPNHTILVVKPDDRVDRDYVRRF